MGRRGPESCWLEFGHLDLQVLLPPNTSSEQTLETAAAEGVVQSGRVQLLTSKLCMKSAPSVLPSCRVCSWPLVSVQSSYQSKALALIFGLV